MPKSYPGMLNSSTDNLHSATWIIDFCRFWNPEGVGKVMLSQERHYRFGPTTFFLVRAKVLIVQFVMSLQFE